MAYLSTHPDFPAFEALFNKYDFNVDVDLANELVIEKRGDEETWVDYDALPKELQDALDTFQEKVTQENDSEEDED